MTAVSSSVNGGHPNFEAHGLLGALNSRMHQAIDAHAAAVSRGEYETGSDQLDILVLTGIAKSICFMNTPDAWPEMVDGAIEQYSARKPRSADWICGPNFTGLNTKEREKVERKVYSRVVPAGAYSEEDFVSSILTGRIRLRPLPDSFIQKNGA